MFDLDSESFELLSDTAYPMGLTARFKRQELL